MSQTRLPERPKPPTGQEIMVDIVAAEDQDVVFTIGQSVEVTGKVSFLLFASAYFLSGYPQTFKNEHTNCSLMLF